MSLGIEKIPSTNQQIISKCQFQKNPPYYLKKRGETSFGFDSL
jgi:hypothetical protein